MESLEMIQPLQKFDETFVGIYGEYIFIVVREVFLSNVSVEDMN
jgi:hypothetical protein